LRIQRHVAFVVGCIRAHRAPDGYRPAIAHVRFGPSEFGWVQKFANANALARNRVVVVVIVNAILDAEFYAFEVFAHDEVDDAGNGVGAVHGGRTTGQNFNALDQRDRDRVQIGERRAAIHDRRRLEAPAVDQDQRALGPKAAQVDGRRTRRTVRNFSALTREHLRQVVEERFGRSRALRLRFRVRDRRNGRDRLQSLLRNTRTGDGDFLNRFVRTGRC
jgi:hypothetical protein